MNASCLTISTCSARNGTALTASLPPFKALHLSCHCIGLARMLSLSLVIGALRTHAHSSQHTLQF